MKLSAPVDNLISSENPKVHTAVGTSSKTRKRLWFGYICSLILSDFLMILLAFWISYIIRFNLSLSIFQLDAVPSEYFYRTVSVLITPLWVIIFAIVGLYNQQNLLGGTQEYALVFRGATINLVLFVIFSFLEPNLILARGWLLLMWGFSFLIVATSRFWLRRVIYALRRRGYFLSPAIIIGANNEGITLARQLISWPTSGLAVLGFVDKKFRPGTRVEGHLKVLGSHDKLRDIVEHYNVGDIILASSAITSRDSQLDIFKHYGFNNDVNVRMSSGLYEIVTTGLSVKEFAYIPLVGVNKVRLSGTDQVLKMLLEFTLVVPALILLFPVFVIISILIKLDSPGPVFHRRRVMGVNERQFDAIKFRTMRVDGDEILSGYPELLAELQKYYKIVDDPRVTKLGRFLRRFSIDELPQLINVIKLDMALVGPRMISPEEMENYNQWGLNLLTVRPGLTGLWQVSGRSDIDYEDRVRLDMYYIRNWSIWQDLQLILRTFPVVLRGKGAY